VDCSAIYEILLECRKVRKPENGKIADLQVAGRVARVGYLGVPSPQLEVTVSKTKSYGSLAREKVPVPWFLIAFKIEVGKDIVISSNVVLGEETCLAL
jgi:hypothetical protein